MYAIRSYYGVRNDATRKFVVLRQNPVPDALLHGPVVVGDVLEGVIADLGEHVSGRQDCRLDGVVY